MALPVALVARQVFSSRDAAAIGVSYRELERAIRDGELTRICRGWFTCQTLRWPSDRHRVRAQAEVLQRRGRVVASHTTGAIWHGLPVRNESLAQVHVMWTGRGIGGKARGGVSFHRLPSTVTLSPGGLVVPVVLACLQAALVDPVSGLMAADQAVRNGATTKDELVEGLPLIAGLRGKGQVQFVLSLVEGRRESPGESEVAYACQVLGHILEPQVWVTGISGRRYRADSVLRGSKVIVEYDGRAKYSTHDDLLNEKRREDDLRAAGWHFVRVTAELLRSPAELDRRIRLSLSRAAA